VAVVEVVLEGCVTEVFSGCDWSLGVCDKSMTSSEVDSVANAAVTGLGTATRSS